MSTYLGNTLISGVGRHTVSNAHNLLDFKWSDHLLNSMEWLNSSTFSWQSGQVYLAVYNHLSADITGKSLQSETISGITIQYYLADDGHKVAPASEETNVNNLFNTAGVAWYYILDTVNERFKLPRSKHDKYGDRVVIGNGMTLGLSDSGSVYGLVKCNDIRAFIGVDKDLAGTNYGTQTSKTWNQGGPQATLGLATDPTKSGIISTPTQDTDQYKYLYFYVGQYTQSAIEQTAGITSEQLNEKVDKDSSWGFPSDTYIDLTLGASGSTYTAPANGYLALSKKSTAGSQYLNLSISGIIDSQSISTASSQGIHTWIPLRKGCVCKIEYNLGGATEYFRFIYAVGSEP